jgi:hypothetical protein
VTRCITATLASHQLDRVAAQPHLTLRFEHEQQHADLLARYLGAQPRMADERAGNAVAEILGFFRPRFSFGRSMAPSRSRARRKSMSLPGTRTDEHMAT